MITPTAITNYQRSRKELELFWIFCLIVAGKNSDWAAKKILGLFSHLGEHETPFDYLSANPTNLHNMLVANRVGQYTRLERAITESIELNLATATLAELLPIFGVGPKTARFFLLHSRRDCKCAVLDVHILRWLRENCGVDAPTQTPQSPYYEELEGLFVHLANSYFPNMTLAQVDMMLWAQMSGRLD